MPTKTIVPGSAWSDDSGRLVQAHGEGIFQVGSTYYMVGEDKANGGAFTSISCYSSDDLVSWKFVGNPLTLQESGDLGPNRVVERPKVIYNDTTHRYVMYVHIDNYPAYSEAKVGIATSATPCGPYTYLGSSQPLGFQSRDIGLFEDGDGSGYLLSEDRANGLRIDRLSADFLSVVSSVAVLPDYEAPAMVKVNGRYMIFGSHLTGWGTNDNDYMTASSLAGTWTAPTTFTPTGSHTFDSQTSFVLPVTGTRGTTYVYMGDRWLPNDLFNSAPVWLPIALDGTTASLGWQNSWSLNIPDGIWSPQNADSTYEAEARSSLLGGGATVQACETCSGRAEVGSLHAGSTVTIKGIKTTVAGDYTVKLNYSNPDVTDRTATVEIDKGRPVPLTFTPTTTDPARQARLASFTVPLSVGTHTLTFGNAGGPAPDLDSVAVPNGPSTATSITAPPAPIYQGHSVALTQQFTNNSASTLTDLILRLPAPNGWTVVAAAPTVFSSVKAGRVVKTVWLVTPVNQTTPALSQTLTGTASYLWGDHVKAVLSSQQALMLASPLTMSAASGWLTPGQSTTVKLKYTNWTDQVVSKSGLGLEVPAGLSARLTSADLGQVWPGESVETTFTVTAAKGSSAIVANRLIGTARYTYGHSTSTSRSAVVINVPNGVESPYRTAASTEAYFGEQGDNVSIAAAGADVWGGTNEYGAVYLEGAETTTSTVAVSVGGQQVGDPAWTRSGIMVRNDIGDTNSAGLIDLAVTPGNGIAMQWDSNGDGQADTSATAGPSNRFPTRLKLVRNGTTFIGSYSIDDGKTWNTVATATLADVAATQDAGMFQSSHLSGVVTRGDFSAFEVS